MDTSRYVYCIVEPAMPCLAFADCSNRIRANTADDMNPQDPVLSMSVTQDEEVLNK